MTAVVADSGYADLLDIARARVGFLPRPLPSVFAEGVAGAGWIQLGLHARTIRVDEALRQRQNPFPLLLLHGTDDEMVPFEHGKRLHSAAVGSELIVCPGAGHVGCLASLPLARRRVGEFWREHLPIP